MAERTGKWYSYIFFSICAIAHRVIHLFFALHFPFSLSIKDLMFQIFCFFSPAISPCICTVFKESFCICICNKKMKMLLKQWFVIYPYRSKALYIVKKDVKRLCSTCQSE